MSQGKSLNAPKLVCFEKKRIFSALQDLASTRSKKFVGPKIVKRTTVWDRKPPDFSPKLYTSLRLPHQNEKRCSLVTRSSKDTIHRVTKLSSHMLPEIREKTSRSPFSLRFQSPNSLESKVQFVKSGKYPASPYRDPKPYDFRQYNDDMPDMVTMLEKDPGNLNFKSQHLTTVAERRSLKDVQLKEHLLRFDTFKAAEPRWDTRLILPRGPWPTKSASYTRHRRRRGVHSALLDRVEEKLTSSWRNL